MLIGKSNLGYSRRLFLALNIGCMATTSKLESTKEDKVYKIYSDERRKFDDPEIYLEKINKFGFKETMVLKKNHIPASLLKDGWKKIVYKPHGGKNKRKK